MRGVEGERKKGEGEEKEEKGKRRETKGWLERWRYAGK